MKVLIVGAGLLGASIAYRLSRAGAEVTVLEADRPGAGATGRSFGWINASFYLNPVHHHLRVAAMVAHHRLQADLPGCAPTWQGTLWWEDQGAGLERMRDALLLLGYPVAEVTGAGVAAAEPALTAPPARALHFPTEGAVDAAALTQALLAASGARVLVGLAARGLMEAGGRITGVVSAAGPHTADHVVLAAGVATPALLQGAGFDLPMLPRPGLILQTKPVGVRVRHILVAPQHEIRQLPDGGLLTPCAANHQADASDSVPDQQAAVAATLGHLQALFGEVRVAGVMLGLRPVPGDGLPVLGRAMDGLSLAVMHSGVTLAPLAAEALTVEIVAGVTHPLWLEYGPDRLLRPVDKRGL